MPDGRYCLKAGVMHSLTIVSRDRRGKRKCGGGDYYEVQLLGASWRSRPRTVDNGNGSYGLRFQVDRELPGDYKLVVILAYQNYDGVLRAGNLSRHAILEEVGTIHLAMAAGSSCEYVSGSRVEQWEAHKLGDRKSQPNRVRCDAAIYKRRSWHGQWIKPPGDATCRPPYCTGNLTHLRSGGWVYSTERCYFHIYGAAEGWECLGGKWWMFWGDSNNQDLVRNLYNVTLGINVGLYLEREFDMERDAGSGGGSEKFRATGIFNGHTEVNLNRMGVTVYQNATFLRKHDKYLNDSWRRPDLIVVNTGLHDGGNPASSREDGMDVYAADLELALPFWLSFRGSAGGRRGRQRYVYKTTVAPAGGARRAAGNAQKLEILNRITTERLAKTGAFDFLDTFDVTFPFHYNNDYSDGGHYGRPPWFRQGEWMRGEDYYFVDLMVGQILIDCFCQKND